MTAFQADFEDAHSSMIYGTSAITNTLDYVHTGLEFNQDSCLVKILHLISIYLLLDSEIADENFI